MCASECECECECVCVFMSVCVLVYLCIHMCVWDVCGCVVSVWVTFVWGSDDWLVNWMVGQRAFCYGSGK